MATCDRFVPGIQERAHSRCTFFMQEKWKDILLTANPVDSLFSVHGACSYRRPGIGLEVMGIGAARFSWRICGSGSRKQGHSMADSVLVYGGYPRVSTRPCYVDGMVRPLGHTQPGRARGMGRDRRLFFLFWVEGEDCPMGSAPGAGHPLQPTDKTLHLRNPISIAYSGRIAQSGNNPDMMTIFPAGCPA